MNMTQPTKTYLRSMRKPIVYFVLFLAACLTCMYWLLHQVGTDLTNELDKPKVNVGKRFIMGKDTLLIVDYSIVKQTYTFDNGREVSFELVPSLKEVK